VSPIFEKQVGGSVVQPQPQTAPASLRQIPNAFGLGGNTYIVSDFSSGAGFNLPNTAFSIYSTDPGGLNVVPEPTTAALFGAQLGVVAVLRVCRRK
jgi:hypothetical protein